jgi:hypothetical protein
MAASLDSEIHDEISRLSLSDDLLDDQVEDSIREDLEDLGNEPSLSMLLISISINDKRLRRPTTSREARALIADNPSLKDALQRSLETRSFKEVRHLGW